MLSLRNILSKPQSTGRTFPNRKHLLRDGIIPGFQGWLDRRFPADGTLLIMDHAASKVSFFALRRALGQALLITEGVDLTIMLIQIDTQNR
jgi:hypothetical protein